MSKGKDSYKFGRKNNWRRRMWNEAIKRLESAGKEISQCNVVYLAGPENLDAEIAIQKGFKPWNLYAVEIEEDHVSLLRSKHVNVIRDNINSVISVWPGKEKIDFIFADFCGGLSNNALMFISAIMFTGAMAERAVVAVNLLRGREQGNWKFFKRYIAHAGTHRGKQFYALIALYWHQSLIAGLENPQKIKPDFIETLCRVFNKMTLEWTRPSSFEYKSQYKKGKRTYSNVFDSVIFNWGTLVNMHINSIEDEKCWLAQPKNERKLISVKEIAPLGLIFDGKRDLMKSTIRKIAAAKAINTMRKNGQLAIR